jgi:hypothetical protein
LIGFVGQEFGSTANSSPYYRVAEYYEYYDSICDGKHGTRAWWILPQNHLDRLRVEVLLKNLQLPAQPGIAHGRVQRPGNGVDERTHAQPGQRTGQRPAQRGHVMAADQVQVGADLCGRRHLGRRRLGSNAVRAPGQHQKFGVGQRHDATGSVPGIQQALDQP